MRARIGAGWEAWRRRAHVDAARPGIGRFLSCGVALALVTALVVPLAHGADGTGQADLQPTLDAVVAAAPRWGIDLVGVSFTDLRTGEQASVNGDRQMSFMSSSKFSWLVMAVADRGIDAVAPHAWPVFANSDNYGAGATIDLAGGLDRVNNYWYPTLGMTNSCHQRWNYGRSREYSGDCGYPAVQPFAANGHTFFNHNSANDQAEFLSRFWRNEIPGLDPTERAQILEWSTWSPDELNPWGDGTITGYLPPSVWPGVHHKIGWYFYPYLSASDVAIVDTTATTYSLAIATYGGLSTGHQQDYMAWASCEIYRQASGDRNWDCASRQHVGVGGAGMSVAWSTEPNGPFRPIDAGAAETIATESAVVYAEVEVTAVRASIGTVVVHAPGTCGRVVRGLVAGQRFRFRCEVRTYPRVSDPWYVTADTSSLQIASAVLNTTFVHDAVTTTWRVLGSDGTWKVVPEESLVRRRQGQWKLTLTNNGPRPVEATAQLQGTALGALTCEPGGEAGAIVIQLEPWGSAEFVCSAQVDFPTDGDATAGSTDVEQATT